MEITAMDRSARQRARISRAVRSYGLSFTLVALLLAIWQFVLPDSLVYVLPRPSVIGGAVVKYQASLLSNIRYTMYAAFMGFVLGNGAAVLMAVLFIYSPTVSDTVYPMAVVLRSIPLVALTPFIVIFFGQGVTPKVVIAALVCFFPTLVNMVHGLQAVDVQALELMHTLNATERQLFWKMRVPYSLPYLFTAFKITSSAAVLGAIIGEWMGAWKGLGAVIVQAMYNMRGDQLWATMLVATALSILAYILVVIAERIFIPWHESVKVAEIGE
jgi:NitT/TauT family transport system permease protein